MPCYDISLLFPHIILPSYVVMQHDVITVDVVLVLLDVINSHAYMPVIPAWCLHLEWFYFRNNNNNPGAYDCLEFSLIKYGLAPACLYLTSEHLALIICFSHFFIVGARCGRMSTNDPRRWGHLSYASCSLLLRELENHLALLCERRLDADSPLPGHRSDGNVAKDLRVEEYVHSDST